MQITLFSVVQGLVAGLLYGLLALGLVLLYRTTRVLNFAQGQLGVVGAVFLLKLTFDLSIPYWPALIFVLILGTCLGALCELLLRRLFDRPRVIVMVATIGLAQVLFLFTVLAVRRARPTSSSPTRCRSAGPSRSVGACSNPARWRR